MEIFDVILKLIKTLTLTTSEEHQQLVHDTKGWSSDATLDHEDPKKRLYAKLHQGVFVRLLMPFAYFFILKYVRDLQSGNDDEDFFD